MVAPVCSHTKNQWIACSKRVNIMVCELHHNKIVIKKPLPSEKNRLKKGKCRSREAIAMSKLREVTYLIYLWHPVSKDGSSWWPHPSAVSSCIELTLTDGLFYQLKAVEVMFCDIWAQATYVSAILGISELPYWSFSYLKEFRPLGEPYGEEGLSQSSPQMIPSLVTIWLQSHKRVQARPAEELPSEPTQLKDIKWLLML